MYPGLKEEDRGEGGGARESTAAAGLVEIAQRPAPVQTTPASRSLHPHHHLQQRHHSPPPLNTTTHRHRQATGNRDQDVRIGWGKCDRC